MDWGDEAEVSDRAPEKGIDGIESKEELKRLCDLLSEQQEHMKQLLARQLHAAEIQDAAEGLLNLIFHGRHDEALVCVKGLRPDALLNMVDPAGMNALHWAVRVPSMELVFALLEKAPQLAEKATSVGRAPPHWTPMMILADQPLASNAHHRQMASILVSHMSLNALSTRGGSLGTVSHLAAARGHVHVLKRVLWRIFDCGGQAAVKAHLAIAIQAVSWQEIMTNDLVIYVYISLQLQFHWLFTIYRISEFR